MIPRIVALVPMRAESERVPGKNTRSLGGRPLYHWIVESLLEVPEVAEVWIDSDSAAIAQEAPSRFERVTVIERPIALRSGDTPMNEVLLHDVSVVAADYYLQTHSTNPFLKPRTISRAIGELLASDRHDSLFSVTPLRTRLWTLAGTPINHNPQTLLRTQDLPPVYQENSNLYLFTRELLVARRNRIGERPLLFEIGAEEAWDIDEEFDFMIAEQIARRSGRQQEG